MQLHEVGECPAGHKDCNGVGRWTEDPFAAEIYDDHTEGWHCDGELYESAMDI